MANNMPTEIKNLIKVLKTGSVDERIQAGHELAEEDLYGEFANPALIEALKDEIPEVRAAAAEALNNVNAQSAVVVDALAKALQDPSDLVRIAAAGALDGLSVFDGTLTINQADTVSLFIEALQDSDELVRQTAAHLLGSMFLVIPAEIRIPLEQKAIAALIAVANNVDEASWVRKQASHSITKLRR